MATTSKKKKLIIVESPAKAKTISKYLDSGYIVKASVGHIRDLPKSNKSAIDIEKGFLPHYEISAGKEKVVKEIIDLAKKADEVILATDPDREGEAIAWHIAEATGLKDPKRIVFHEITKEAVQEAMKEPRVIDDRLRRSQEARRVLDRLVGYDLSGLIWKKVRYGLSAGRVQSPALRIIMEREREIRAFDPEDYWIITADVKKTDEATDPFTLVCSKNPKKIDEVEKIIKTGKKEDWVVSDLKETENKRHARPPFKTSTLQQTASSRFGFAPSRTMRIAQKLYEKGLITYMRTDSMLLSQRAQSDIIKLIEKEHGKEYALPKVYATKSKTAQEAHEAIRPTNINKVSAGTTEEENKLYRLIWQRAISSQMQPARVLKTKIIVTVGAGSIPTFHINGSRILFPGWLKVDTAARGEDVELPKVSVGEILKLIKIESEAKQTQPPSRYSEAGLIKELEKREIGRPSTYATILKNIIDRGYVENINKSLHPTDTGDVVSSFLEEHFTNYISDSFTSIMEGRLDDIALGKRKYAETLKEFYGPFLAEIKSKENMDKLTNLGEAPTEHKCPKCGKDMIIKLGKSGKFISCSDFPKCEGALTIDGKEIKPEEPIGTHPETGEKIYLLQGPYGPYVQLGENPEKKNGAKKRSKAPKPKRASVPKDKDIESVSLEDALKYLSLPKDLGVHPETGKKIASNVGRFGPYIVHDGDFRSLKTDDVYEITLERALEILSQPKKIVRRSARKTRKK
jgi:DNA topoisomerase I